MDFPGLKCEVMYHKYKTNCATLKETMLSAASLDADSLHTCLSPFVKKILCDDPSASKEISPVFSSTDSVCVNLHMLVDGFPENDDGSFEYFLQCADTLKPIIYATYGSLHHQHPSDVLQQNQHLFSWTSSPNMVERAMEILSANHPCSSVHAVLLLTAVLERSLGDVYLMKGKPPCPAMLKDLLATPELAAVFGDESISVLRCLIGPPTSLNIRNVLWHGFPAPGEIHIGFGYFLFCLICTLGEKLASQPSFSPIRHRKFLTFPEQSINLLRTTLKSCDFDLVSMTELMRESNFVYKPMVDFWHLGLKLFHEQRYGECCVILLPQLEHGMRRVFAAANDCPHRILTAENTTLFTTFDEILASTINEGEENQLLSKLEHPYLHMLMDVLRYPDGPRLRDRLSHGEADVPAVGEQTAAHVIGVCAALCLRFLPPQSKLWQTSHIVPAIQQGALEYHTVFHPTSLALHQLQELSQSLSEWNNIPAPPDIESTSWHRKESVVAEESLYSGAASSWAGCHTILNKQNISSLFTMADTCIDVLALVIKTDIHKQYEEARKNILKHVFCAQDEEMVRLVHRICTVACTASTQVLEQGRSKCQSFLHKTMRSRQRNTYRRMLNSLVHLWQGFRFLQLVCATIIVETQLNTNNPTSVIKLLKLMLQYCENLIQYTNPDKNKWEEAKTLSEDIIAKVQQYMVKF